MRRLVLLAALVFIATVWTLPAGAAEISCLVTQSGGQEISCQETAPTRGQSILIRLTGAEDPSQWQVAMTYRPNSAISETTAPMKFDDAGEARLKPAISGIVQITAEGPYVKDQKPPTASLNVPVRYPSPPISGIIILLVAGVILFGGAGYSLAKALKE